MKLRSVICPACNKVAMKPTGAINRARKIGAPIFCDRICAGLARQNHKPAQQKKAEKQAYDAARRTAMADEIKARKAEYYRRTHDPVREAIQRKKRMPSHLAYCRTPEYRTWKREYDRKHNAKVAYGEFWECALLVNDIREEALSQSSDYQIRLEKGGLSKNQQRKRDYEQYRNGSARPYGQEHEDGSLGDLERRQERGHAAGSS